MKTHLRVMTLRTSTISASRVLNPRIKKSILNAALRRFATFKDFSSFFRCHLCNKVKKIHQHNRSKQKRLVTMKGKFPVISLRTFSLSRGSRKHRKGMKEKAEEL